MAHEALSRDQLEQIDNMWKSPGLIGTLIAVATAFGSWTMLLPTLPLAVIESGGSKTLAGATTGIFMLFTVITQMFTPRALRTIGYTPVMVFSAAILGVPALAYMLSIAPVPVLAVSAIRGIGFGSLTVAQAALIAELVPLKFLGKASGALGLVIGLVEMLVLPLGLNLAKHFGFNLVYGITAAIAVVGAVVCSRLPRLKAAPKAQRKGGDTLLEGVPAVATWKLITVPAIAMCGIAMGFGALNSFLPAAVRDLDPAKGALIGGVVLAIVGGAQMVSRYAAGMYADRKGQAGLLMIPSLLLGVLGLLLVALVVFADWNAWLMLVAALSFGLGFGAAQNEALLMMFARLPRERVSDASAMWNISFDSGTGLGSVVLGFVAARLAYDGAFFVAASLVGIGLSLVIADSIAGKHRIAEYHNTRAHLRRVPMARATYHGAKKVGRVSKVAGKAAARATVKPIKPIVKPLRTNLNAKQRGASDSPSDT